MSEEVAASSERFLLAASSISARQRSTLHSTFLSQAHLIF